jgi:transposase
MKASKCWLTPSMKLSIIKERGPSITVIGAISAEHGLIHTQIFKKNNNALHFQQFLYTLKRKCAGRRVVVILDNLRVHQAKILSDIYTSDFKEFFLPPYSSVLNPIERLWALLKRRLTQQLYQFSDFLVQNVKKYSEEEMPIDMLVELVEETLSVEKLKEKR